MPDLEVMDRLRHAVTAAAAATRDPDRVMSAVANTLDAVLGPLEAVVHIAGDHIDGMGQLCSRCGHVLEPSHAMHARAAAAEGADQRRQLHWPAGAHVSELRRWGRPATPRTWFVVNGDPDPAEGERWCQLDA